MNYTDPTQNISKPKWLVQSVADLARHEGFREFAYPDPLSRLFKRYPKEKWGFQPAELILAKLGEVPNNGVPWTVGYGFTRGIKFTSRMSLAYANKMLEDETLAHAIELNKIIPSWNVMPLFAQSVLVNLVYNLGPDKLKKFVNTLRAFKDHDWKEAAEGLRNSAWYKQVGNRAVELVARLENQKIEPAHVVV